MRWLLIVLLFHTFPLAAQERVFEVSAALDTAHIRLGEPMQLSITATTDTAGQVEWPAFADRIQTFYVISSEEADVQAQDQSVTTTRRWQITAFDTGFVVLEPIAIGYFRQGESKTDTQFTEPLLVRVDFVAVDTAAAFKPIKAPINVPLTWRDYLPWILGSVALLAAIAAFWWWWKKRRQHPAPLPQPVATPGLPAHEEALLSLSALEREALWQQGAIKEYHVRLTDIIRTYIEKRFEVEAHEKTTDEVLHAFRTIPITREQVGWLQLILQRADLVKFARFSPLPEHHEESLRLARQFVTQTQPADIL